MHACTSTPEKEESKRSESRQDLNQLMIVTLHSIELVQQHLDKLNTVMHKLSIQAVKAHQESENNGSKNQLDVTVVDMII